MFQFLIGRVKRVEMVGYTRLVRDVSIPYRQSQKNVSMLLMWSFGPRFQFLIGRVKRAVGILLESRWFSVSIPYRQSQKQTRRIVSLRGLRRFNSLQVESKGRYYRRCKRRAYWFQFLIGRVKRLGTTYKKLKRRKKFQFLIGRVKRFKTPVNGKCVPLSFNSLQVESKGTLQVRQKATKGLVSIPYRQSQKLSL